jgi:phosphatidylserine/phosphatidylglycerophosphate/cardiolipin synthase-like enzyme
MATLSASTTRLLIQPGAGTTAIVDGIDKAQHTIHIVVFRFDRREIEMALKRAARRGVFVHALVAHTSAGQGGEITLRKLEMRLLADGITVTRTASDLVRYHDKLMIVDNKTLYLLGFNFTYLDIDRSRSFGVVTQYRAWVEEAEKLFIADATRQQYTPECDTFIVSPGNSRTQLMSLLESAQQQLLIYDDKLSDPDVMRLLARKVRAGIDVRMIGVAGRRATGVKAAKLYMRLHAQIIICDAKKMFLGSQSLRTLELDARRETGILTDDPELIQPVLDTFEADWSKINGDLASTPLLNPAESDLLEAEEPESLPPAVTAESVKAAVKEAIIDAVLDRVEPKVDGVPLKEAVKEAAREALHELASR